MEKIKFPYGKTTVEFAVESDRLQGVLTSSLHDYKPAMDEDDLVLEAMENPVDSPRLRELAKGKQKIVIIASDHTRPVPSKRIIPHMLEEIRQGSPDAEVTLLIATGCHRGTTREELVQKFGEEIVDRVRIVVHDCLDEENLIKIGTLPSGGDCVINRLAWEADLLVAEGFIEPHFFAGYSGGRKSVLPGIAGRTTVLANHCGEFIASPYARTGILEHNPLHEDMVWAAQAAKLRYIVNVVIDAEKKVVYATAGDALKAHQKGCDFLKDYCGAKAIPADIVITTNGGYPLDQNIYQSVKGMTAAGPTVKQGGVIIMLASASDGHGGEHFYRQMSEYDNIEDINRKVMARDRNQTEPDQWMTQILCRILKKATVIYVSEADPDLVSGYHLIPAKNLTDAMAKAEEILGNKNATVTAIPDGVSVMVYE